MKEKDIKIITLSDEKLLIFSPPTSINQFDKNNPHSSNNDSKNTVIYANNSNKAGFTYFSKVEYLGSGGFSKVYKYRGDLENKAVKKVMADPKYYSKSLTAEDSIKREVYGMTKVDCNHSLKVYGVYQNTDKNIFYILMEQCDGNIENYVKNRGYPLNINEIIILLCQLNDAFYLLNKNNIIHRDIKPSNILYKELKDDNPDNKRLNKKIFEGKNLSFKIGDYGVCIPLYDKEFSKSQFMGTLDYMAPEIYEMKCEKEHPVYTKKIDLFSLGQSILWLMGFFEKANTLTKNAVENLKKNCKLFEGNHKEKLLADLVFNHLLIFDVDKRDGWEEYFNHPLFEEFGVISGNENKNYTDGNSQRVKRRVIKRNNFEIKTRSKLFNSEKKLDIKNKLQLKISNEENNKININKNVPIYKYRINTNNVEKRPVVNILKTKINININHKNTFVKNIKYSDDKYNINEANKKNNNLNIIKIEKKKTFDFPGAKKFLENKNDNSNENKKQNQINIITNDYFKEKKEINLGRNSTSGAKTKSHINDINSHFISIRSKYKKMSQNKDNYDIKNKMIKKLESDNKKEKQLTSNSSFVKSKKNDEEKKSNSKDKYSKSDKKYNLYFRTNIDFIEKKNTVMKNIQFERSKNEILDVNKELNDNDYNNIKETKYKNSNIRSTSLNYNTYKNKKYSSIKVINYRIEENKKNKNIGFYFSKYSNTTKKV